MALLDRLKQRFRDGAASLPAASSTVAPTALRPEKTPEQIQESRLTRLQAEGREIWIKGDIFDNDWVGQKDREELSDEQMLAKMQKFRRAALVNPESVMPHSQHGGVASPTQYPDEHNRQRKIMAARLSMIEEKETPKRWATDMNRDLVTKGMIIDRPLMLTMRAYEMEMRTRQERVLVNSKDKQDQVGG